MHIHFVVSLGKGLPHVCLDVWKGIPQEYRHCTFTRFKKYFILFLL